MKTYLLSRTQAAFLGEAPGVAQINTQVDSGFGVNSNSVPSHEGGYNLYVRAFAVGKLAANGYYTPGMVRETTATVQAALNTGAYTLVR